MTGCSLFRIVMTFDLFDELYDIIRYPIILNHRDCKIAIRLEEKKQILIRLFHPTGHAMSLTC